MGFQTAQSIYTCILPSFTCVLNAVRPLTVPSSRCIPSASSLAHPLSTMSSNSTLESPPFLWRSGPSSRGTLQILTTCASTLLVCVWSAIHKDVPEVRLSTYSELKRKLAYLAVTIFVPEFLLLRAAAQLLLARALVNEVRKHAPSRQRASRSWTAFIRKLVPFRKARVSSDSVALPLTIL